MVALALGSIAAFLLWPRGVDVRDGRHDRGRNAIWLQHGWLGDRQWFVDNDRLDRLAGFRDPARVEALATLLRDHHVRDVYPHLCPTDPAGSIPAVDPEATERFLDAFEGLRVMPWVGGVLGRDVIPDDARWRARFVASVAALLAAHPRLAGVHVNVEPCPSGNRGYLRLLDDLRAALPPGRILSIAAYPPTTPLHPFPDVHWDEAYFRQVSRRVDQVAVMMYDTALVAPQPYRGLMARWTGQVLAWSGDAEVLLGVPAYEDAGVGYHHPEVENVREALLGIHQGLDGLGRLPPRYAGVAIYSEWTMDEGEWRDLRERFLAREIE